MTLSMRVSSLGCLLLTLFMIVLGWQASKVENTNLARLAEQLNRLPIPKIGALTLLSATSSSPMDRNLQNEISTASTINENGRGTDDHAIITRSREGPSTNGTHNLEQQVKVDRCLCCTFTCKAYARHDVHC